MKRLQALENTKKELEQELNIRETHCMSLRHQINQLEIMILEEKAKCATIKK